MKVSIVRGGGVGGLASRAVLDSDALPAPETAELDELVDATALRDDSADAGAPRNPLPDELLYSVIVDERGVERTRRFVEGDLPEAVRALIEWVDSRPECEREVGGPGQLG